MKVISLVRGLVASCFALLAIGFAAFSGELAAWIPVMIAAHIALPLIAAFSGKRADAMSLDIALATLGSAYMLVMLFMPRGAWPGSTYVTVAVGYSVYAVVAALVFASLSSLRTALRVQGWKRLRAQRNGARTTAIHADAE
jgi:hypothetical protein